MTQSEETPWALASVCDFVSFAIFELRHDKDIDYRAKLRLQRARSRLRSEWSAKAADEELKHSTGYRFLIAVILEKAEIKDNVWGEAILKAIEEWKEENR